MDSKKPLYKSITFWVLVLFLLYSALGFLAVPYYLKNQFTQLAESELNSQVSFNKISFNPYSIAVDVSELSLRDINEDNTQWFKAENIYANLDLWKTLFNHVSLSEIHLEKPQYHLVLEHNDKDIQLKYPKLVTSKQSDEKQALQLDINDLSINQGSIKYTDALTYKALNLNFAQIKLYQTAFTTQDKDVPFGLSFTTEADHNAVISGYYNLTQKSLKADWKVENWSTVTILKLAGKIDHEVFGIINHSGKITAQGQINFSQSKPELANISIDNMRLSEFNSSAQTDDALDLKVPLLTVNQADIDLNSHNITVEKLQTEHNALTLGLNENNELLWDFPNNKSNDNSTDETWQFSLKKLIVGDSDFNVSKFAQHNTLHIKLLQGTDISTLNQNKSKLNITGIVDKTAHLDVSSQIQLSPLAMTTDLKLENLKLKDWQNWMPNNVHMKMADGLLSTQQHITMDAISTEMLGHLKLNNAVLLDDADHQFFAIDQLMVNKNTINFNTKTVELDNVILKHAQGDLLIAEDKTLNLNNIINSDSDTKKPSKNIDDTQEKFDWKITINAVELNDSQTSITDKSTKPNYHSQLSKVNGSIKGLSSQNLSKADVQLSGLLDTYGKLDISGQINPLSDSAYTDLNIDISNLDIQNFSTYSKQYLGFPIQRGKADFTLKYKLNEHILKGVNKLTFQQLKFGDKSTSKDAINLPIKLAVNLLTDGKGIMKINMPVSGNVDDPNFSYGGLVFKAFFKLITGIVASPFKLLGKLIPNGADLDLSGIQFKAGMVELKANEVTKLQAIQKIMQKRPNINLELTPVINSIEDAKSLKTQQLLKQLKLTQIPDFSQSMPLKPIKKVYIAIFSQEEWRQLNDQVMQNQQLNQSQLLQKAWKQLLESQDVSESLKQLSLQRAQYIQSQLIEQQSIPKEKVFIQASESSETLYPQVKFGIAGL